MSDTDSDPMFDVVVVGSLNLDVVATTSRLPRPGETVTGLTYAEYPGGKGLNQAVAAARAGATVALIGCVGDDEAGDVLRRVIEVEGIDGRGIVTIDDETTGRAVICVDSNGENSIVVVPGANGRFDEPLLHLPPARAVLVQLEIPLDTVTEALRRASEAGSVTILDPAPAVALPTDAMARCSIVVPNEHEVELIGGVEHLRAGGVGRVVVTLGGDGVDVHPTSPGSSPALDPIRHDAIAVDPVDTTGAGDAFRGALAARLARGDELDAAVRFAGAAGALATTTAGAVPSLPRRAAIDALLLEP